MCVVGGGQGWGLGVVSSTADNLSGSHMFALSFFFCSSLKAYSILSFFVFALFSFCIDPKVISLLCTLSGACGFPKGGKSFTFPQKLWGREGWEVGGVGEGERSLT